ncbi:RecBCD enzyme subunit RecD [Ferrovum myxofaciens]|uniref:RecBCD enzyme subunit RecD n=1 Tax=Ferrovum myxofaciens TaxID=416213 RepID=A0A149VW02_9PROT|nr:DUF3320 domain-containing protein [Ferrovum myxofaciens]KXW57348.1 RecBCD enzyme subunit RecD [Ferrovum myxofaciens]
MTAELVEENRLFLEQSTPPLVEIEIVSDPTTGYAAIQNSVPVVRVITLSNKGDARLTNIELLVHCSPSFALGTKNRFESLVPGENRKISPIDLQPDHGYLSNLDESERATISVTVISEGLTVAELKREIEVLAYDQWAGTRSLPELLAAFCMPNSRVVDQLIGKSSALLRKSSTDLSMNGYQSKNRERVWKQVSAIYSTLMAEDIHYSNPPASFGADGQKIRSPERIFDGHVATCLDLALLFASCFEQVGLHSVVLFKEGHAWVGVWLLETSFQTSIIDDVQAIRKRVKSGELMVFEATGVASAQKSSLRWACSTGEEHLHEENSFSYAVDIRRARELQIRALPSKSMVEQEPTPIAASAAPAVEDMPDLPPLDPSVLPVTELTEIDTPESRLAKWKSKLLDLTLRNRLLNFKPAKTNLQVICPDPAALEDTLSEGKEFRIRALPKIMDGSDPREATVFANRNGQAPLAALATDALSRREIVIDVPEAALEGRLLEIYRAAETGLEEGGANTLFLVFGLLQWWEEKDAEASHLAPILLIPVTLTRQSVRSGFRLTRHDDDALVNPTLIQKLSQDYNLKLPSYDVLPLDDKGVDVGKILQTFRLHVAELKGWEVKDQVHLGIFSFTKYLMWKDLQDRQKQLQENNVVAHLINNPGKAFFDSEIGFDPRTLDDTYKPQDLFVPLLSDSSQLRAICAASGKKNLVIEGPPGTGKSQTITNLIAHLLATGKTVLFVSEKMAALEVVHRRLNSLGLGPFCLELHSAKAKKSDLLKQLDVALHAAGSRTVKDWEMEAERLAVLRQDLNALAQTLHREHPNDLTIYEAIGTCIEHAQIKPAPMNWADPNSHNRNDLETLREISRQMAALASQLIGLVAHPLSAIVKADWSPTWQQELLDAASCLSRSASQLQDTVAPTLRLFGLPEIGTSLAGFAAIDQLADTLIRAPKVSIGIARAAHDESARNKLHFLMQHGLERQQAWDSLGGNYREDIAKLNAGELELQWAAAQISWWPKSWFAKRIIFNRLRLFRNDQKRQSEQEIPQFLKCLTKLNAEDGMLAAMSADANMLLAEEFVASKTDWAAVAEHEQWAKDFSKTLEQISGSDSDMLNVLQIKLQPFVTENRSMLKPEGALGEALLRYRDSYRIFIGDLHRVSEIGCCKTLVEEPKALGVITRLLGILQGWRIASRQLQPWCLWQGIRAKAVSFGLHGIVQSVEAGDVAMADLAEFFEYSYQHWWVRKVIDLEPVLCSFSSADHERKILEFRKADERFQKLTEQYIIARLSGQIPTSSALVPGADSEMGKLRRELQKQRKHMPIRQLVQGLPTLLSKLKPCLLMSPLSVSQYLAAGHAQFDVVIFDEASQIPVWDAVGAIARGQQLVCVGDPKQLPPTNFFNRTEDSDSDVGDGDIQDMESILDECLSVGMPKLSLNWHYRSRHESLITFSNVTYYESSLITFPSPVTEDKAVRFERVRGVYDRGGSRTNRAEAEAIVHAIEKHYTGPVCHKYSLGVVTFNQAQQKLIENLLDARRRASPTLDQAIAQAAIEPLFIKNLENVQGDERDIIFFSVTYGPDAAGKVSLNFGPLNLEGGHRRLNVVVSRARLEVVIFSTLMPEQIDLSKVRAAGVRDLKNYLEFALRGPRALVEQTIPTGLEPDSSFERQVIIALRNKGWTVHPQVGVSGYRIDIGVVDPRAPGRYLLGIECDGRTYHSGATARDRDRLRQHILENLGWQVHRIWSTDWWMNPQEALQKLLSRIELLLTEAVSLVVDEAPTPPAEEPLETHPAVYAQLIEPDVPMVVNPLREYRAAEPSGGLPDAFYENSSKHDLRRQLLNVINTEGPILDSVLFKRIARAWGLAKTGKRIEELLRNLVPSNINITREGGAYFYWPVDTHAAQWKEFRVAGQDDSSKRVIEEISLEEIGNLALFVLTEHGATSTADLARTICRLLRIARTTDHAEARVSAALRHGLVGALVESNNGTVSWSRG